MLASRKQRQGESKKVGHPDSHLQVCCFNTKTSAWTSLGMPCKTNTNLSGCSSSLLLGDDVTYQVHHMSHVVGEGSTEMNLQAETHWPDSAELA